MASPPEDVGKLESRFVEEGREIVVPVSAQLSHDLDPTVGHLGADVLEHERLSLFVQHDLTTGRQEREALHDVTFEPATSASRQRPKLLVPAELLVVVSNEVQNREYGLVSGAAETSAQLL
jgi:hypothetical protein